jgi:proteasome activator subunit 4
LSPASSVSDLEIITGTNGPSSKKKDKLILITLVNTVYSLWGQSFNSMPEPVIELIPILAHYANETMDEELKNSCSVQLVHGMGTAPVSVANAPLVLAIAKVAAIRCSHWKAKLTMLKFLQVTIFANLYLFRPYSEEVREIIVQLLSDPQLEVRVATADTLCGFIHCSFLPVDKALIEIITEWTTSPNSLRRHAGVLALQAVIRAFPYTVPSFLPEILMTICRHANEREPIRGTVKKALNEFKRTHQDMWAQHKQEFNEDQLAILTSVLVSPNYYV